MDWTDHMAETNRNLAGMRKAYPEATQGFSALAKGVMAAGALDTRTKELQCVAIAIVKQCNDCIGMHVRAAIAAGATREEMAETVAVAMIMGGGPAFMYGARALDAWDQFAA